MSGWWNATWTGRGLSPFIFTCKMPHFQAAPQVPEDCVESSNWLDPSCCKSCAPSWLSSWWVNLHLQLVDGSEHVFFFPYIYIYIENVIIPTDELIFFRGIETTNQHMCIRYFLWSSGCLLKSTLPMRTPKWCLRPSIVREPAPTLTSLMPWSIELCNSVLWLN